MRLANGIVLDKDTTFGELKFSALRREVRIQNEDGSVSDEIKERTYDLKSLIITHGWNLSIPLRTPLLLPPIKEQMLTGISRQTILC